MNVSKIIDTPTGTMLVLENGQQQSISGQNYLVKTKKMREVITTKHERFIIYKNGEIVREVGTFDEQIPFKDRYAYPVRPQIIDNPDTSDTIALEAWAQECKTIQELNKREHKKQAKKFRLRIKAIRHHWKKQQKNRRFQRFKTPLQQWCLDKLVYKTSA